MSRPFHLVIVLVAVFAASLAFAAAESGTPSPHDRPMQGQSSQGQAQMQGPDQAAAGSYQPNLTEVSKLLGMRVNSTAGENLGTIQDLVIEPYESRVSFAVLSPTAGGESLYAVPWSLMSMMPGKDAVSMNITKDQFDNAPCFSRTDWPDVSSQQWRQQIYGHYNVEPASQMAQWPGQKPMTTMPATSGSQASQQTAAAGQAQGQQMFARRVSDLLGMDVKNAEGENLGKIRDVVVDTQRGHIAYSVLALPQTAEGQKLAVVPWPAVELSSRTQMARINTDLQTLMASTYNEGDISRLSNEQYARTIYDRFNKEPYWEVYGYAPGRPAAGGNMSNDVWAPNSSYNQQFNKDKIVTIEGTIMSVGTFQPQANSTPGLRLTIESKDGRLYTVGAGPWDYVQKQNVTFSNGQSVTVTGSEISSGTIMASDVNTEQHKLSLRSRNGEPKWNMSDLGTSGSAASQR